MSTWTKEEERELEKKELETYKRLTQRERKQRMKEKIQEAKKPISTLRRGKGNGKSMMEWEKKYQESSERKKD